MDLRLIAVIAAVALTGACSKKSDPAAAPACALGTAFATVDDYQLATTGIANAAAATADASGKIYVVGFANDSSGKSHWIVRKSSDRGVTWVTLDDFQLLAGQHSLASAILIDSAGTLWVTGNGALASGGAHWLVRKSSDAGATWTTVDDFQFVSARPSVAGQIVQDSSGNFYVAGQGLDLGGAAFWLVRKSATGASWATVDGYSYPGGLNSYANCLAIDSSGNLFAGGYALDGGSTLNHWVVRKGTVAGTSWATVDDYQLDAAQNTIGSACAVDAAGVIYASGVANDGGPVGKWLVRKSADHGVTWTTADSFSYQSPEATWAQGLGTDSFKSVYALGFGAKPKHQWVVRKSADSGATWTTVDDFTLLSTENSAAMGLTQDSSGDVFVTGSGADSSAVPHWLVRKLACN